MTTMAYTNTQEDEAALMAGIERWSRAFEARDIDAMMVRCHEDIVLFDIKPPGLLKGVAALRAMWETCLPYFPKQFKSERKDLTLHVSGDVAFMHCLHRLVTEEPLPGGEFWIRITVGYRKIEGEWKAIHEHVSHPFNPMTGQVEPIPTV